MTIFICEYPGQPMAERISDMKRRDLIKLGLSATKGYAAVLAHEIDHLNGVLYIDHRQKALNPNV